MAKKKNVTKSEYENCSIEIEEKEFDYELKIDKKGVEFQRDAETGAVYADENPYQPEGSIEALAKSLIDYRNAHSDS